MAKSEYTSLACTHATKRRFRECLRGGESHDDLLQKMIEQYELEDSN